MNQIVRFATLGIIFISSATYADVPNLCKSNETTIWSCKAKKKIFSLCASKDLSSSSGYMQYRAGKGDAVEFSFPKSLGHPKGHFEYSLLAHGAMVSFCNGGFEYSIGEDMKGGASISVSGTGIKSTDIPCGDATDSLTLNSTIDLFKKVGISE